ncbi:caspase recruitment domain-containing protein 9 [Polymixia lowei]
MAGEVQGVCVSEDDMCWIQLEDHRLLLIKSIDPARITPYLRQCQVISAEDEEQIFNDPNLVIKQRKVGALLDILQRTGVKGYTAFLESLELDYPKLYSRITGKQPNKTFSILIDTAGESGLTQFLMSEVSRLQRALQEEKKQRHQACSVIKEQEEWLQQQQLTDRELRRLSERVQKSREEKERLNEEVKHLREHNYILMADVTTLGQEKNNALLANKDLQLEMERMKHTQLTVGSERRLGQHHSAVEHRPQQGALVLRTHNLMLTERVKELENRSLVPPTHTSSHHNRLEEDHKEELPQQKERQAPPHVDLLSTICSLRKELQRAEEQRARSQEEKEVLELRCAQLKGDARMYRQQNEHTLRQLEEVARERDKALSSCAELQAEVRGHVQEKDQYREQVRQLRADRLHLLPLRSQGAGLQLQTRPRRKACSTHQCERSESAEEEEPTESATKGSSDEVPSGMLGMNEEATAQQHRHTPLGAATESGEQLCTAAPWEAELSDSYQPRSRPRPHFFYRRKRAVRSKVIGMDHAHRNFDDSSGSDITDSDGI